jgi:hypothetical protein
MTDTVKPLPPLSPAALRGVLRIRGIAIRDIKKCNYAGSKYLDHDRALEVIRTHALEELAVRLDFYIALRELPDDWADTVAKQVVHSAISWFPINEFYLRTPENQLVLEQAAQFTPAIERTVADHLIKRLTAYVDAGKQAPISTAKAVSQPENRKALAAAYRAAFPDVKIADIIWAAKQTRREWTRWTTGKAKDGLKPDRSFRHVLTSGKKPEEIRGMTRPTKYDA